MYPAVLVFYLYYLITYCNSFIIPNELPSLLSIIYSNIPPVKVGIDSRFGYGFRLGPHADYQSLVEIGPQLNTNPLSSNDGVSKRQSIASNRIQRLFDEVSRTVKPEKETKEGVKTKKTDKTLVGKIEFKKVPGIDDFNEEKIKKPKNTKISKEPPSPPPSPPSPSSPSSQSSPTKFDLLKTVSS